ncbi:molybdopterin-synthase adenylyltransferase MoeB [Vibrio hepatarius]|uniref:molybdopterin-synthase adenylyltransferase MoeB n=1 Tax=Vibrio hepatarius TaxID=171383 RepID=UPI001C092F7A|nr:molybdopterin-synthase adenylyltransferase MoeB [Vibrio hepatarius]
MTILSDQEMLRYNRQIMLRDFDFDGQEALKKSRVLVIGIGGLGCAASQYLSTAGIGTITLVDDDIVELSNLHRQVLHLDINQGQYKVHSAKDSLKQLNPYLNIRPIAKRLDCQELESEIIQHTLVLDCSDNLETRNHLNSICYKLKVPLVSGAAIRMEGQVSVFTYKDDNQPCYQCFSSLIGNTDLSCVESGVMPPIVGIIGAVQALEAIKVIAKFGQSKQGKIFHLDGLSMSWREMNLSKVAHCIVCGTEST